MKKTQTAAVAPVAASAEPTKMTKLLNSWFNTNKRATPSAVDFPHAPEVFALLAGYDSKQVLRLAGFLQSVGKVYHSENEMTAAEKQAEHERHATVRREADEDRTERNLTPRSRAERDAREAAQALKADLPVFAPDLDSNNNYVLFKAFVVTAPAAEGQPVTVKWADSDDKSEVPFVVPATTRAHRMETHRVPTDAQCDVLDTWFDALEAGAAVTAAAVEAAPAPTVTKPKGGKAKAAKPAADPVANDADMLDDSDLMVEVDTLPAPKGPAKRATTTPAAAVTPAAAKARPAKATTTPAKGAPAKRVAA